MFSSRSSPLPAQLFGCGLQSTAELGLKSLDDLGICPKGLCDGNPMGEAAGSFHNQAKWVYSAMISVLFFALVLERPVDRNIAILNHQALKLHK